MIKIELHRLAPQGSPPVWQSSQPLETRVIPTNKGSTFFLDEFGDDGNSGIDNALDYVKQKYGGGKYELRIYHNGRYTNRQFFELAGKPKDTYVSPFTGKVT